MKRKRVFLSLLMVFLLIASVMVVAGCSKEKEVDTTPTTRTITDMAGREVTIPAEIKSLATVGPGPVLNSLIFAVGEGDKIVNGLPEFARTERWKYQHKFAPHIKDQPVVQSASFDPNVEELLKLKPDVVFTMEAQNGDSCIGLQLSSRLPYPRNPPAAVGHIWDLGLLPALPGKGQGKHTYK
jgi:iron complex transport system substrate-binding protein